MANKSAYTRQFSAVLRTESEVCTSTKEQMERSKSHWSHVVKPKPNSVEEEVIETNVEVFKTLQKDRRWGSFFRTFGEGEGDVGVLVMGKKFAEGGQAELYQAQIKWRDEVQLRHPWEWVLKVFKEGNSLKDLQNQWPRGMLKFHTERAAAQRIRRFNCDVVCGTLLDDYRFAFVMRREQADLRTLIERNMKLRTSIQWTIFQRPQHPGPFVKEATERFTYSEVARGMRSSYEVARGMKSRTSRPWTRLQHPGPFTKEAAERLAYEVARGVDWLHTHNIVHGDLKAANVLVREDKDRFYCFVCDYECSIGVVGTGFFRAPEILQACKDKKVFQKPELFTKEADAYSYGMTCYEILTGNLPFEGHLLNDYDLVLKGERPEVPEYVDDWMRELLSRCWESESTMRPSFGDILKVLRENSAAVKKITSMDEDIAHPKCFWSQHVTTIRINMPIKVEEFFTPIETQTETELLKSEDFGFNDEELAEISNVEVFKTLQMHPTWGDFFITFDEGDDDSGELVVGEKFAEGGQAELFEAQVKWRDLEFNEYALKNGREYVLKVFKKGTFLRHLQSQWPHGYLQFQVERWKQTRTTLEWKEPRYVCHVMCGTLLKDGRFAFLLRREQADLRSLIDRNMKIQRAGQNGGPFSQEVAEGMMHNLACGMDWLHTHNIVHRDLKASNVLVSVDNDAYYHCFVCDFECSIGVLGTGFHRAPEILQAWKDKTVGCRPELFSEESDVYSYGMTCYEILTGKLPFEDHPVWDYGHVLGGNRPELPEYVDDWARELLSRCWQSDPIDRPSFKEILKVLRDNSAAISENTLEGTSW